MPVKEEKYIDKNNRLVMTRLAAIEEQNDRSFDIEFWQRLTDEQRLTAVWELVVFAHKAKGRDPSELRLQRTVENLKRRED
ncbi:MAG: hypothetical protein ACR2M8_00330 [Pyrinomonadaceae bacterium]|nr:hypothetical protein [Acidobacteriota bacterium]MDQ3489993.1 hypothetical protein [Acidobacteriota bacterium]